MSDSQPPASEQYESFKNNPAYREPTHDEWLAEVNELKDRLKAADEVVKAAAKNMNFNRSLYIQDKYNGFMEDRSPDTIALLEALAKYNDQRIKESE